MTKTRTWAAATAGICVLLILAAWFLLISPKRAEAADLRDQTVAQDQANQQTEAEDPAAQGAVRRAACQASGARSHQAAVA
jgi:hypothetical protein